MSSLNPIFPNEGRDTAAAVWDLVTEQRKLSKTLRRNGMNPRQQTLNHLYAYFACLNYASRTIEWDGSEHMSPLDVESVASRNQVPPGFYDAGQETPLRLRRPSAPYRLARVIVQRFSALLFSEATHPVPQVPGDPQTQDYLEALLEECRMWSVFATARDLGGAMGSVGVGFQFLDGSPKLEIFDPRWTTPTFDPLTGKLAQLEVLQQIPQEEFDGETGDVVEVLYWHRRVITRQLDVRFAPVEVEDEEPRWQVQHQVKHGFGFVPAVWIQNSYDQDNLDGDPDCQGTYEAIEEIDALTAQAVIGTKVNADPTLLLSTPDKMGDVKKGSDNAIKLTSGTGQYLELAGTGAKAAMDNRAILRADVLETVQCVLPDGMAGGGESGAGAGQKTATEVRAKLSAMYARCDRFREQYGQHGVRALCEMLLKACRLMMEPKKDAETGELVKQVVKLPPRFVSEVDPETGSSTERQVARVIGRGEYVRLKWPPYSIPTAQDTLQATQAVTTALQGSVLDEASAVAYIAPYYGAEDVQGVLRRAKREAQQKQQEASARAMEAMRGIGAP